NSGHAGPARQGETGSSRSDRRRAEAEGGGGEGGGAGAGMGEPGDARRTRGARRPGATGPSAAGGVRGSRSGVLPDLAATGAGDGKAEGFTPAAHLEDRGSSAEEESPHREA